MYYQQKNQQTTDKILTSYQQQNAFYIDKLFHKFSRRDGRAMAVATESGVLSRSIAPDNKTVGLSVGISFPSLW